MNQHLKHYNQTHTRMNENAAMKHAHTHARAQFTQTPKFLQYKDRDTF